MKMNKLIFWGGTGQAIMLEEFLSDEYQLTAVFDNNRILSPFNDVPIYQGWKEFAEWKNKTSGDVYYIVAIGGGSGRDRVKIHDRLKAEGLIPIKKAVHPSSYVSPKADLGEGCQIMPNASVTARATLGKCVIVNTSASVDHECNIGNGVHIGPGAHLSGCIQVGDNTFIGTGATILPRLKIGSNAIIGAGSVVTKDLPNNVTAYGNPCHITKRAKNKL
ncbi:MAG: acetyltransferase [Desulfobacter sp.]|nr:MAG: acetyltransferase [Desulfobacter sp.]